MCLSEVIEQNATDATECQRLEFIWFGLVLGVVCLLGYVGNILCLMVLHRSQRRRRCVTFLLLKALAGADLLYLLLYGCIRMWLQLVPSNQTILPYMFAYVWPFVSMLLSMSTWLMVLLTIHRYIVVCHPLEAQHRSTPRVAGFQIAVVCIVAVAMDIPRFFEFDINTYNSSFGEVPKLSYTWLYDEYYYHLLYKNTLILTYRKLLPLAITITLTVRLVSSLYKAHHRRGEMSHIRAHFVNSTASRERRITKALLAVVIVFIMCQMPGAVYPVFRLVLQLRCGKAFMTLVTRCGTSLYYLKVIADGMTIINSAVNFLIYMSCSAEFRSGFYKLGRRFTWSSVPSGTTETHTRPQPL